MQIKLHAKGELFKQQLSVLFLFSRSEQRMRLCKIALFRYYMLAKRDKLRTLTRKGEDNGQYHDLARRAG